MKQVKGVRRLGVINKRNRQIACQRLAQETVKRFVQMWHFVSTCSRNEQRNILRKILD